MLVKQRIKSIPRKVWSAGDNFIQSHGITEGQPYGEVRNLEIEGGYGLLYFPEIRSPKYGEEVGLEVETEGSVVENEYKQKDFLFPWAPHDAFNNAYYKRLRVLKWILSFLPPNAEPLCIGINYPVSPYYAIESQHGYMSVSPSDHPDRDLGYREEYGLNTPKEEYAGMRYDWFADLEDKVDVTTMDLSKFPHSSETRLHLKKLQKKAGTYGGPFMDPRPNVESTDFWTEKALTESANTNGHIFLFYKVGFWVAINKRTI